MTPDHFRCTTPDYDRLYARWLDRPGNLLDIAGYEPGQRLLDLCGGTGAVSLEALRRGADPSTITLVDLNPRCPDTRIEQVTGDADRLGQTVFGHRQPQCLHRYDLIVIRQAAAYLEWNIYMLQWLVALLRPTGKLVFNTFAKPRWSLKTYLFKGVRYYEGSAYCGGTVWHVQAAPSIGVDVSRFQYIPKESMLPKLERVFNVTVIEDGKSLRWICTPKRSL